MLVKIIRDTVADCRPVKQGEVLEINNNDARTLVFMGKAVPYDGEAPIAAQLAKAPAPPELEKQPAAPDAAKGEDALPQKYSDLCVLAETLSIESPAKIKKALLIEMIQAARAAQA